MSTCKHILCLLLYRRLWKARAFCKTQSPSLDILSTVLPVRASVRPCVREYGFFANGLIDVQVDCLLCCVILYDIP